MKRIAILGSTGSIGQSALSVIERHHDRLKVVGLAAGENAERLAGPSVRFRPAGAALASRSAVQRLRSLGTFDGTNVETAGPQGLVAIATASNADIVLCASSGTEALEAILAAIECGKTIALANKEVLVM